MTAKEKHLKSAKTSFYAGALGALALMLLAAFASYAVRGEISILVLFAAGFAAVFHFLGCLLFVNHFKMLAAAEDE